VDGEVLQVGAGDVVGRVGVVVGDDAVAAWDDLEALDEEGAG